MGLNNDICIDRVVNAFYLRTDRWKRDCPRTRPCDAAVLFTEGEIEYYFENKTLTVRAGDLLLLSGDVPYAGQKKSRTVAFYVLEFTCAQPHTFAVFGAPQVVTPSRFEEAHAVCRQAITVWQRHPIDVALRLKFLTYSLLSHVYADEERKESTTPTEEILAYIVDNLHDSAMTVTTLCRRFYISESQLRRNLHKATGLNPNEYLWMLRLNRAQNELVCTAKPIRQIAAECGFSSAYYFTRRFTARFGQSPSDWRKTHIAI